MTCWILLVSELGFLGFAFACLALFKIAPAALKVNVKVSPWSVSASVEMEGGSPDAPGVGKSGEAKNVGVKSVDAAQ